MGPCWLPAAPQSPQYQGRSRDAILQFKTGYCLWILALTSALHRHSLWQHQQDSWQLSTLHTLKHYSGPAESQIPADLRRCTQAFQDVAIISDYSCNFEQRWEILYVLFGNYMKVSRGFILALQFTTTVNSKPSDTTRHINQQFHSYVSWSTSANEVQSQPYIKHKAITNQCRYTVW